MRLGALIGMTVCAAVLFAGGCGSGSNQGGAGGGDHARLTGAGSSFVYPLVSAWAKAYRLKRAVEISYSPVGSGGGIQAIASGSVDFGASDAPLTPDQKASCSTCVEIPWALSATAIAYHGTGLPNHLKITGPLLAKIYLGALTRWNDPRLTILNPGVALPDLAISPIFRSDGSGTTYNFTDYLSNVSSSFRTTVGTGTQVSFPVGIGGSKSSGVAGTLSRTEGGLTYVDVAYARSNNFSVFAVQNAAGMFATPTLAAIRSAAVGATTRDLSIVDPPASRDAAYPICTFTNVILRDGAMNATALKRFVSWALTDGQRFGPPFLFAELPEGVARSAQQALQGVR